MLNLAYKAKHTNNNKHGNKSCQFTHTDHNQQAQILATEPVTVTINTK